MRWFTQVPLRANIVWVWSSTVILEIEADLSLTSPADSPSCTLPSLYWGLRRGLRWAQDSRRVIMKHRSVHAALSNSYGHHYIFYCNCSLDASPFCGLILHWSSSFTVVRLGLLYYLQKTWGKEAQSAFTCFLIPAHSWDLTMPTQLNKAKQKYLYA